MNARTYISQDEKDKSDQFIFEQNKEPAGFISNVNTFMKRYCQQQDIGLVLKGTDFLIGRYALSMINHMYGSGEAWMLTAE